MTAAAERILTDCMFVVVCGLEGGRSTVSDELSRFQIGTILAFRTGENGCRGLGGEE
jgi:hypothetical protein